MSGSSSTSTHLSSSLLPGCAEQAAADLQPRAAESPEGGGVNRRRRAQKAAACPGGGEPRRQRFWWHSPVASTAGRAQTRAAAPTPSHPGRAGAHARRGGAPPPRRAGCGEPRRVGAAALDEALDIGFEEAHLDPHGGVPGGLHGRPRGGREQQCPVGGSRKLAAEATPSPSAPHATGGAARGGARGTTAAGLSGGGASRSA